MTTIHRMEPASATISMSSISRTDMSKRWNKSKKNAGLKVYNLGTGRGYSVLDVIHAFEKACGHEIPYAIKPRRAGDIAMCYAQCDLAKDELGWQAQYDLDEMCASSWKWQTMNPDGYLSK